MSILALIISIASVYYTATSSNIERERFREAHAVIVVSDKDPSDKTGLSFKLHAQDSSQKLQDVRITFPSILHSAPVNWNPEDGAVPLFSVSQPIQNLCAQHLGRIQGSTKVTRMNLPVFVDTTYSIGGNDYQQRGVYYLRAVVGIAEKPGNDSIDFTDLAFSGAIEPTDDAQKIIDNLLIAPTQPD